MLSLLSMLLLTAGAVLPEVFDFIVELSSEDYSVYEIEGDYVIFEQTENGMQRFVDTVNSKEDVFEVTGKRVSIRYNLD
jgi:hypothetical protein